MLLITSSRTCSIMSEKMADLARFVASHGINFTWPVISNVSCSNFVYFIISFFSSEVDTFLDSQYAIYNCFRIIACIPICEK